MTPLYGLNHDAVSMVGVLPGPHTLTLVPRNNDHSMIMSAAVNIPFTYARPCIPQPAGSIGTVGLAITAPLSGLIIMGNSLVMTANVSNFTLFGDCCGKVNVAGQGHWHVSADAPGMSNMLTMAGGTTQEIPTKGLTNGWHTFWAVLVSNQHMPSMPMVATPDFLNVHPGTPMDGTRGRGPSRPLGTPETRLDAYASAVRASGNGRRRRMRLPLSQDPVATRSGPGERVPPDRGSSTACPRGTAGSCRHSSLGPCSTLVTLRTRPRAW